MVLFNLNNRRIKSIKNLYFFSIILIVGFILILNYSLVYQSSMSLLSYPLQFFLAKTNQLFIRIKYISDASPYPLQKILLNLSFTTRTIYHHNGIAYDYYSKYDLGQSKPAYQWKIWPLPNEINQDSSFDPTQISPFIQSKLPFIDVIYVMTDPTLTKRHTNLKKAFKNQGISLESVKWRMKWNYSTCNSNSSHSYVYERLNLNPKPLSNSVHLSVNCYLSNIHLDYEQQRRCSLAMKHVDVWYEMAEENIGLGLIIEDDAIFVPFFKEKLTRMISQAMNEGILRINGICIQTNEYPISNDERIDQNPMFVIGSCFNFHDKHFKKQLANPLPILSTHKSNPSRCTHAYLLTSCSAKGLVDQIHRQKNDFWPSDFLLNYLFNLSWTLQSFWLDPPLSYQGNQVIDLDNLETFKKSTY